MSEQADKIALILCNCGKTLENYINFSKVQAHFQSTSQILSFQDLCFEDRLNEFMRLIEEKDFSHIIIAACSPQIIEMVIEYKLKTVQHQLNFEIVNIREQCAWVHKNIEKSTEKVIQLIQGAYEKLKNSIYVPKKLINIPKHVTIIGAGISGLTAAADISNLGFEVLFIEKNPWIGGHLIQLDNISPFNKSGSALILDYWSKLEQNSVSTLLNTKINWIEGGIGDFRIHCTRTPAYVNENCNRCKKCFEICPKVIDDPLNVGLSKIKAIHQVKPTPLTEAIAISRDSCPDQCRLCQDICPENAINLSQESFEETIQTSFIIFATGYELFHPDDRSMYRIGQCPDILTQLQLARMLDSEGPTQGVVIRPSTGIPAKKILMVQCVGSRDVRDAEYCSEYCCSTAINHALEIKDRDPEVEIGISYIDIRTKFMNEEIYREARESGIDFIRGKIGNIVLSPNNLITEVIDTILARQINYESDIIVLSTAMLPSKLNPELSEISGLKIKENGFIQEYYPKLKLTETNKVGIYMCGTVSAPKLVADCIAEAHSVAVSILKEYPTEALIRQDAISMVNQDLCNGCELCARLCPFQIPIMIEKEGELKAIIDEKQCKGCGTCASLCPTNAVQLESLQRDQLFAQIKGILSDAPLNQDPIILGFVCEECAYATIDFAGMLKNKYSEHVRFIRLPCIGRLSILDILTALESGADLILIFGCEDEKCHYLEGNTKTKIITEIIKEVLNEIGWESDRLKMYGLFSADLNKFIDAIQDALKDYEKIGHTVTRLKLLNKFGK